MRHRGTLVCVVLKGKQLPVKRLFDTQDPVAEVCVDGMRLRTLPDRRGGACPFWDEQMHFEVYERTPPVQHTLELVCYATDKEPDYIGHAKLDLTRALTRGEHDLWLTLTSQGLYAGQVYVELTFYTLELPPQVASPRAPSAAPRLAQAFPQRTVSVDAISELAPTPRTPHRTPHRTHSDAPPRPATHSRLASLADPPCLPARPASATSATSAPAVQPPPGPCSSPPPPPLPPRTHTAGGARRSRFVAPIPMPATPSSSPPPSRQGADPARHTS